jgi:hypothetical protein
MSLFRCLCVISLLVLCCCSSGQVPTGLLTTQEELFLVDIATDATDPCNLPDGEPSIAVNPTNNMEIIALSFAEGWGQSTCKPEELNNKAPLWKSTDGGKTWQKQFILPQTRAGQFGPFDQSVSFDNSGHLVVTTMDDGKNDTVYSQIDGSSDLVPGIAFGNDQPIVDIDRNTSSKCFGRLYSAWSNVAHDPQSVSMVSNSANFVTALHHAQVGVDDFPNRTARVAVGADGTVYAVYKTQEGQIDNRFENARFRVIRSNDCGGTWERLKEGGVSLTGSTTARTWFTANNGDGFGNASKGGKTNRSRSSDAWITVNANNGDVYVAFVNVDHSGFSQIFVARSMDRGETWNITQISNSGHHSGFPEIAVAANGTLGVLYIDYDDSQTTTVFRHLFARSSDQGISWRQDILQTMDLQNIILDDADFIWGDYEGLSTAGNLFYGVFTGESIGRSVKQLDPIFFKVSAEP